MRAKVWILIFFIGILSGCSKKSDNIYKDVGETATTREIKNIPQQQTEKATENNYSMDKENVKYYIEDSHFYDVEEGIDFACEHEEEEKFHIRILNAYTSDNLQDFGEYFCESEITGSIEEALNWCEWANDYSDLDLTYMCVQVEITNKTSEREDLDVLDSLRVFTRINDERGKEYGLADKYISFATAYNEIWYDSTKKENEKKSYYLLHLSAGETITTNCVYIMRKEFLDDELYLNLHQDEGEYNNKYMCVFPPTAKTTKFLKINLKEN